MIEGMCTNVWSRSSQLRWELEFIKPQCPSLTWLAPHTKEAALFNQWFIYSVSKGKAQDRVLEDNEQLRTARGGEDDDADKVENSKCSVSGCFLLAKPREL